MKHSGNPNPIGAIETGGTKIVCAVGTGPRDFQKSPAFATADNPTQALGPAIEWLHAKATDHGGLQAIGIASFGPIDFDPKSARYGHIGSTSKPGWKDANVLAPIQEAFPGIPIALTTDVNAAALGEHCRGKGIGVDNLVYVTIGTGIGAGVICGGRILQSGSHPEIGHMLIPRVAGDKFPGVCPFHGDCWEGLCSGPALARRAGIPAERIAHDWDGWPLVAEYIARALVNVCYVVTPRRIILGGSVAKAGRLGSLALFKMIRERMSAKFNDYAVPREMVMDSDNFLVYPGLGDDAGLCGAIALAQEMSLCD